nr:hypothetical protein [Candidatus Freyarchaeota archaeon]
MGVTVSLGLRAVSLNTHGMITHWSGLVKAGLGFKLVANAEDSVKVIVEPCWYF